MLVPTAVGVNVRTDWYSCECVKGPYVSEQSDTAGISLFDSILSDLG